MNMQEQPQQTRWYQSRLTWVLLGLIAIGGFFLLTGHTAHVLGLLPFPLSTKSRSDPYHVQLHSRTSTGVAYDERRVTDLFQPLM